MDIAIIILDRLEQVVVDVKWAKELEWPHLVIMRRIKKPFRRYLIHASSSVLRGFRG
jgi:hypothetical protein